MALTWGGEQVERWWWMAQGCVQVEAIGAGHRQQYYRGNNNAHYLVHKIYTCPMPLQVSTYNFGQGFATPTLGHRVKGHTTSPGRYRANNKRYVASRHNRSVPTRQRTCGLGQRSAAPTLGDRVNSTIVAPGGEGPTQHHSNLLTCIYKAPEAWGSESSSLPRQT